jgi:hypothetical protein
MRTCLFIAGISLMVSGCTHLALERNTLQQAETVTDLRYKETLTNLAIQLESPATLPYYSILSAGGTQIVDTGNVNPTNPSVVWDRRGFNMAAIGLNGSRALQENWTLDSVKEPEKLLAMRCAYHHAMRLQGCDDAECSEILEYFHATDSLAKISPGWYYLGRKCDVPKDACYEAHCGKQHIWVTKDGLEGLTQLTLTLLNIATADLGALAAEHAPDKVTVQTANYEYDPKDSSRVKKITTTTQTVSLEDAAKLQGYAAPPGAKPVLRPPGFLPRIQYQGNSDPALRSAIMLQNR